MNGSPEQVSADTADKLGVTSYLAIFAIAIGFVLNPFNGSLVVTAYPHLAETFALPYTHMSAMVMYFMAATAASQPLAGGIGDSIGRKKLFLIGIAGFTAVSYLAATSVTFSTLLFWRIAQAIFSGVILANALGLVGQVVPAAKTGIYLGLLNSIMVAVTALGFPLGGILVELYEWPMLFWINIPLGVIAFALAVLFIPGDEPRETRFTAVSFIGLPFLPLAFVLQAVIQGEPVFFSAMVLLVTTLVVAVGIFKSSQSRRQFKPINNRVFNLSCSAAFFTSCIQFGVMFTLPAWTLATLSLNSGSLGLYLTGFSLTIFFISPLAGKALDKIGEGPFKWLTLLALGASLALMILAFTKISFVLVMGLLGIGIAISLLISQRSAMLAIPSQSHALAMGLFSSWRAVGGLSGNTLAAIVLGGFPAVTAEAGVHVFEWQLALFFIPLALSLFYLRAPNTVK
ncbi:MFS transporter [Aestuariicella hydrocarbonica]|uniref:MFS transporter n=1 Tax=Pseudomaricurvus hydrocarbonicus TaxID=1470433 RepID=A0A9E5MM01_9GAMM|nr:MFS transporter [Aestuariicella hydrocarbonica]NHO65918.1 MFS transporter [Aestuariicella hydrocarbonica]